MTRIAWALAKRQLIAVRRRPQFLAPLLIFPTMLLAVNTGGLASARSLEGFPEVDGLLDFQLAAAISQSLLLGGVVTGVAAALEIELGFFDRLVASPIPRPALVAGRLIAGAVIACVQLAYFLVLGLVFGASIKGGVVGVLAILAIGVTAGVGFGAIGQALAYRARNASTVQGIFPLVFVLLFVSSAFFPRELLGAPADVVADYNPLSYIADGMRDPVISSVTASTVLEGLAAALGVAVVAIALSLVTLRGRLRDA